MSHKHDHDHTQPPVDIELRVRALESLLQEKGLIDPAALDELIDTYEHKVGPRNGAQVVARAWSDPEYKRRLMENATAAIAELGFSGIQGEDMLVVENTPDVHNVTVCTLCSCYPWPGSAACVVQISALSFAYRHRPARRSRRVRVTHTRKQRDSRLGQQRRAALSGPA